MDYELLMNGNIKLGQKAPDFTANSTFGKINLSDYSGKWLVFFSHPGDFTPVCTTEMIAFARAYPFFQKLNNHYFDLRYIIEYSPYISHLHFFLNQLKQKRLHQ